MTDGEYALVAATIGIVIVTLVSPCIAIQVERWIERSKEQKRRKIHIFETLMATRAARTSPNHVMALNAIDLAFNPGTPKEKHVLEAWRIYFDHLSNTPDATKDPDTYKQRQETWNQKNEDLFVALLKALSDCLDYQFDEVQLRRGVYYPVAHGEADAAQWLIRDGLVKLLTGQFHIPMDVKSMPFSQEAFDLQKKVNEAILKSYQSGSLQVVVKPTQE